MFEVAWKHKKSFHTGYSGMCSTVHFTGIASRIQRANIQIIHSRNTIQSKLSIGQPNDQYEQETDRVSDR